MPTCSIYKNSTKPIPPKTHHEPAPTSAGFAPRNLQAWQTNWVSFSYLPQHLTDSLRKPPQKARRTEPTLAGGVICRTRAPQHTIRPSRAVEGTPSRNAKMVGLECREMCSLRMNVLRNTCLFLVKLGVNLWAHNLLLCICAPINLLGVF